ncbi:unnamed protein product [Caenorhabditis sp. 36 PRJEB53466]|nr:unnamed protein product [Caenorhabditis sp. 36 PRJEB53466]
MGCTHSKNSKSKAAKAKNEQTLERSNRQNIVAHFDETNKTTPSTSNESEEQQPMQHSKNLLNETVESTYHKPSDQDKNTKKQEVKLTTAFQKAEESSPTQYKPQPSDTVAVEKKESPASTAVPPTQQKQFVASTYYPMPTVGEKQKSPERKKPRKKTAPPTVEQNVEEKKKKENPRDKTVPIGPNYRPQLTPEDLECIRRSVQQRNERRQYMMAHRNETDDTLYELEVRMPEKDYTNRIEATQNSRVY